MLSLIRTYRTKTSPLADVPVTLVPRPPVLDWLAVTEVVATYLFRAFPLALALYLTAGRRAEFGLVPRKGDVPLGLAIAVVAGAVAAPAFVLANAAGAVAQVTVVPRSAPAWYAVTVGTLAALSAGALEEVIVTAYTITRLGHVGVGPAQAVAGSAVLRAAYHLYQGPGAAVANVVGGAAAGAFFVRTGRTWALVVAHVALDLAAFVLGYFFGATL